MSNMNRLSKLKFRPPSIIKKMFQYGLGVIIVTILATPVCFGIIIDTFDEYSQSAVVFAADVLVDPGGHQDMDHGANE